MKSAKSQSKFQYAPEELLNTLIQRFDLKNDAGLSRALKMHPPVISKIRRRKAPITASVLLRMHEMSNWSLADLRALMGDQNTKDFFRSPRLRNN